MLTTVATVLAGLIAVGIIVIGLQEIWRPRAAAGFGIPGTDTEDGSFRAWLSVKAVRDIASGVFILIVLVGGTPQLLGWFMLAAAGIPAGDALVVLRSNGPRATAYGVHGATAVVALASAALLLVA